MVDSGPLAPCYENMMSSTDQEVLDVSQRRRRKTEPRPQVTCTKKSVKIGYVVIELCERTDKQTDRQTYSSQHFAALPGGSIVMYTNRTLPLHPLLY